MDNILVACGSRETAERGLRLAAALSVACGARLSLVYCPTRVSERTPERAMAVHPAAGLDAVGHLSNVLFAPRDWRSPTPAFSPCEAESWLPAMSARVSDCWEAAMSEALSSQVVARQPDLVITCDGQLARRVVQHTPIPVWRVRSKHHERPWFSMRKLRCAVHGSRAARWAGTFAQGLGVELETTGTGLLRNGDADLVVVARESRPAFVNIRASQPVVVI